MRARSEYNYSRCLGLLRSVKSSNLVVTLGISGTVKAAIWGSKRDWVSIFWWYLNTQLKKRVYWAMYKKLPYWVLLPKVLRHKLLPYKVLTDQTKVSLIVALASSAGYPKVQYTWLPNLLFHLYLQSKKVTCVCAWVCQSGGDKHSANNFHSN